MGDLAVLDAGRSVWSVVPGSNSGVGYFELLWKDEVRETHLAGMIPAYYREIWVQDVKRYSPKKEIG